MQENLAKLEEEVNAARTNLQELRSTNDAASGDVAAAAAVDREALLAAQKNLAAIQEEAEALKAAQAEREEAHAAKVKELEQQLLSKDQEITSLSHKLTLAEEQSEKYETKLTETKAAAQDAESSRSTNDALSRKVQLLEEELDAAEKHSKEVVEKYVSPCNITRWCAMAHDTLRCVPPGCGRSTSRQRSSSGAYRDWSRSAINGRRSTRCVALATGQVLALG